MELSLVFYCLTGAFFSGGIFAWGIGRYGGRLHLMDRATHRSSHSGSIPKGGGLGVLVGFVGVAVACDFSVFFWLPPTLVSLVSLWGDQKDLSVKFRLAVQFSCAMMVLVYLLSFKEMSWVLWFPVLLVFIAGTANVYNFMDGINGMAGISAVIGFGLLSVYACLYHSDDRIAIVAICIAVSALAFLYFNLPEAQVFMGDVGSVFLGFVFAVLTVLISDSLVDVLCLAGFLSVFYCDEISTMILRLKNGESLATAHRKHLYQILANEGQIAHWKVSTLYGLAQLAIGTLIFFIRPAGAKILCLVYVAGGLMFAALSLYLRRKAEFNEN